jgi:hypothetical protein
MRDSKDISMSNSPVVAADAPKPAVAPETAAPATLPNQDNKGDAKVAPQK